MKTRSEPAATCRQRGWKVGTVLEGDEGYGPQRILITAIGENKILARMVWDGGREVEDGSEGLWTLEFRDWKIAPQRRKEKK